MIDIQLILRAKMEGATNHNLPYFKQQIIICNDYNLSQLHDGMGTEQGVGKGIKMVDMNTYVSSAL